MTNSIQVESTNKQLLSLIIAAGLSLSTVSFLMLDDQVSIFSLNNIGSTEMCDSNDCYVVSAESSGAKTFVQHGIVVSNDDSVLNNEIFTDLEFIKNTVPTQKFQLSGNMATLFAEKDSFIREGLENINEGSNEVLRVMGTGPTNNRALIAFDQEDIESSIAVKSLQSATLKLYVESSDEKWENGQLVNLHRLTSPWIEGGGANTPIGQYIDTKNGVTWKCSTNSPDCQSNWNGGGIIDLPTDSVFISNHVKDGYWIKFDVTQDVMEFLSGTPNHGWLIMKSDEDSPGRINFAARENPTNVPELVVVFEN